MRHTKKSPNTCKTMIDVLQYQASTRPNDVAFQFVNEVNDSLEEITYAELNDSARALAMRLISKKLKIQDRVILLYPPGFDLIIAFFACFYAGIIAIPAYPPANSQMMEKLQFIIGDSSPAMILATGEIVKNIKKIKWLSSFKYLLNNKLGSYIINRYFPKFKELTKWDLNNLNFLMTDNNQKPSKINPTHLPQVSPSHIAFLQYTSGSTGNPKGVMITHDNLLHNIDCIYRGFGIHDASIAAFWLPPYHDMGLIGGILAPLYSGDKSILMSPLLFIRSPLRWLQIIAQYRATVSGGPNFAFEQCINKISDEQLKALDLSSWEVVFNGAEPVNPETLEKFYQKFKVCGLKREALFICYGLAEATVFVTSGAYSKGYETKIVSKNDLLAQRITVAENSTKAPHDEKVLISSGMPLLTIKIVNPETKLPVLDDEVGEIWVAGKSVAKGYWNKSELTTEMFQAQISTDTSQQCYLRTGDLGFIDNGQLYVTGRHKDLIIINGKNYYPHDIEAASLSNVAQTDIGGARVAALALAGDGGEKLTIVCESKTNEADDYYQNIANGIRKSVGDSCGIYVSHIIFIPLKKLPRTTSGKIRHSYIKKLYLENALPVIFEVKTNETSYVAPRNLIEHQLSLIWSEALNLKNIGINANFFELGGESLTAVRLLHLIEKEFKVSLPLSSIFTASTISSQADLLTNQECINDESPIVFINPKGDKHAIFAIHPLGGSVTCYAHLSRALGESQPFYGLQALDVNFSNDDLSIDFMAKHYIEAIKKVQPNGPYLLLGHSSGGLVATRMAQELEGAGERVPLIIMLDTIIQSNLSPKEQDDSECYYLGMKYNYLLNGQSTLNKKEITYEELKAIPSRKRIKYIFNKAIHEGVSLNEFERYYSEMRLVQSMRYFNLCNNYQPGVIDASIIFFKSSVPSYNDAAREWKPYSTGKVHVVNTDISHQLFNVPDHAPQVAKILQDYLSRMDIQ